MGEQWEAESSDDDLEITSVVRRDLRDVEDPGASTCMVSLRGLGFYLGE